MRWLREQSLSLFFLAIFLATTFAESVAGHRAFNQEQQEHQAATVSYARYLYSSDFGQAVMENWQSEWLQFALFILATVWFVQKGSPESKLPGQEGVESDEEQQVGPHAPPEGPAWARLGGWRERLYENSMALAFAVIFFGSWFAQSVTAWNVFNDEQEQHGEQPLSWGRFVLNADFWERTFQNWQSEFLAVGTAVVFAVYLRQRGSPESKPVGAPHVETESSG